MEWDMNRMEIRGHINGRRKDTWGPSENIIIRTYPIYCVFEENEQEVAFIPKLLSLSSSHDHLP